MCVAVGFNALTVSNFHSYSRLIFRLASLRASISAVVASACGRLSWHQMQLKLNSTQSPRTQRPFKGLSTTLFMPSNLLHVAASQIALHKPTIMFLVRWPSTLNLHVCIQVDVMCVYTIYSVCVCGMEIPGKSFGSGVQKQKCPCPPSQSIPHIVRLKAMHVHFIFIFHMLQTALGSFISYLFSQPASIE